MSEREKKTETGAAAGEIRANVSSCLLGQECARLTAATRFVTIT